MKGQRTGIVLKPDCRRVLFRPFDPVSEDGHLKVVARIMALSDQEVKKVEKQVMAEFGDRHQKLRDFFLKRY